LSSTDPSPGLTPEEQINEDRVKVRFLNNRIKHNVSKLEFERFEDKVEMMPDAQKKKLVAGMQKVIDKRLQREEVLLQKALAKEELDEKTKAEKAKAKEEATKAKEEARSAKAKAKAESKAKSKSSGSSKSYHPALEEEVEQELDVALALECASCGQTFKSKRGRTQHKCKGSQSTSSRPNTTRKRKAGEVDGDDARSFLGRPPLNFETSTVTISEVEDEDDDALHHAALPGHEDVCASQTDPVRHSLDDSEAGDLDAHIEQEAAFVYEQPASSEIEVPQSTKSGVFLVAPAKTPKRLVWTCCDCSFNSYIESSLLEHTVWANHKMPSAPAPY
jgi:hypothetical protein